jgi:hypothetical protein
MWLDITGCTAVFYTEAALAQDLAPRRERNAIPCRQAIAGTTGAAWALAHMLERFRRAVLSRRAWQRPAVGDRLDDCSATMARITEAQAASPAVPLMRNPGHPGQERVIPRSWDFH